MTRQSFQTKRPRRVARWMIEISATLAAMGVAIAVVTPIAGAGDNAATDSKRSTTRAFSRLGDPFAIEGLEFDRPGWWNVKLQVSAPNGMDSLAFNLVR